MELILAKLNNIDEVASLYESVKGMKTTVWTADYPNRENAAADVGAGGLFLLREGDALVGCCTVESVAEDDDLPFWKINDGTHREISRLAINPDFQGKGYAKLMMTLLLTELKKQGVRSVHLLAAKANTPACRTYKSLGFDFLGECFRYGNDFYVCELVL